MLPHQGHLRRLDAAHYRGHSFVHWTLNVSNRTVGWLSPTFHAAWGTALVHTTARYRIAIPTYVLMPDHAHLLCVGLERETDQVRAVSFLQQHTRHLLAPADWQHQAFDHVLREADRENNAFAAVAQYILENPVRAGLASDWREYRFSNCCVAGFPDLDVRRVDYWELFWRIYAKLVRD